MSPAWITCTALRLFFSALGKAFGFECVTMAFGGAGGGTGAVQLGQLSGTAVGRRVPQREQKVRVDIVDIVG